MKTVGSTGEFVEITPGGATGLQSGTKLLVKRLDPKNPKFVGYLIVRDEIDPDKAACQFELPKNVTRPSADDYPQPGDVVEPESK